MGQIKLNYRPTNVSNILDGDDMDEGQDSSWKERARLLQLRRWRKILRDAESM